ncbi:hypothetical protein [Rhizobium rhizosphaerae]|uniref:hypothetical protein n=1 Tax=Xaviernesmea rhizosphaerae TaxID=1672749 RepID=UPI000A4488EB|nr:hypothetical protein [Xaviernesmea rhizosphaerae]
MKTAIYGNKTRIIPREPDGDAFFQIYSGGMRAAELMDKTWYIGPILENGHACSKGTMSRSELQSFLKHYRFKFVAFQIIGWTDGDYHCSWSPFIPGQTKHMLSPADLWSNIRANLAQNRTKSDLRSLGQPTYEKIAAILDSHTDVERVSASISLSLRNLDISVEQICDFYNEKLTNHLALGHLEGIRSSSSLDNNLYAYVHSFFMHLGAARDYIAAFCSIRIGKDPKTIDSFAKLIDTLRSEHVERDEILKIFLAKGYIKNKETSSTKFETSGWMKEATDLRNEFMHRRPFGERFLEKMGFAEPVDRDLGLYRYKRPIIINDKEEDALEIIIDHYRKMTDLCSIISNKCGFDASITTLTDEDIISYRESK